MTCFCFRIRKKYFDLIVRGEKIVEYRRDSPFWQKRIQSALKCCGVELAKGHIVFPEPSGVQAVFLCLKEIHRREILKIDRIKTPDYFSDQGKLDVNTEFCWAFHLGAEFNESNQD